MKPFAILLFCISPLFAQTLQLPPRSSTAPTGSQLYQRLAPLNRATREDTIFRHVITGNIPDFLRTLVAVSTSKSINGTNYTLEYYVTPDYLALGHDTDYVLMPMTPVLAQKIANALSCTLPTAKMVDQIYSSASVKLPPQPIPPDAEMINIPRFYQHNDSVKRLRNPLLLSYPLGSLVGGTKKDVVIDKKVYSWIRGTVPKPVVIYGWHQLNGVPIQPTYNGHGETYADYSHGIRMVQRSAKINGAEISLIDIVKDPVYFQLICDTVLVKPYYNSLTGDDDAEAKVPSYHHLKQNYPNPFNPTTTVEFSLAAEEAVSVKVYNSLGKEVATIVEAQLPSGTYAFQFGNDGNALSSGMYFCRLQTQSYTQTQKMVLLR